MKIIISPAKSLDFERHVPTESYSLPLFQEEAQKLNAVLAKKNPKSLARLMGISEALADLNWQRNQDFQLPFTTENSRQAVYAFNGDVYQGLDVYSLDERHLNTLQKTLRILSGLYGVLRPLDLIQPYRLEMGTSLRYNRKKNLYEFWSKKITKALNEDLAEGELFVNLASKEYFKAVDTRLLKVGVVTPHFKEWHKGQLKMLSFFAKKARGSMARYLIESKAQSMDDLKGFDYDKYRYSEEHTSDPLQPVFVR